MSEPIATGDDPVALARQLSDDNGRLRQYAAELEVTIQRITVERDEANYWRQVHIKQSREQTERLENALSDFQIAHDQLQEQIKYEQAQSLERQALIDTIEQLRTAERDAMDTRDKAIIEHEALFERYQSAVEDYAASVAQADHYYDAMRALARVVAEL
jgi:pyruvate-formate lyase